MFHVSITTADVLSAVERLISFSVVSFVPLNAYIHIAGWRKFVDENSWKKSWIRTFSHHLATPMMIFIDDGSIDGSFSNLLYPWSECYRREKIRCYLLVRISYRTSGLAHCPRELRWWRFGNPNRIIRWTKIAQNIHDAEINPFGNLFESTNA